MNFDFEVGDVVRLTGADWGENQAGAEVEIIDRVFDDSGDPIFEMDGKRFAIFVDWNGDRSATLVRKAGER